MAKTRRILPFLLLLAIPGTISWFVLRPHDPEPIYKGKPLTWWLAGFSHANRNTPPPELDAQEALQQIGTNAIPTLLRLLRADDSKFKLKLVQLAQKQHLINLKWRTALVQNYEASFGFMCLGTQARSAVPALIQIYKERHPGLGNDPKAILELLIFLGPVADEAVPLLVQVTTDINPDMRLYAVVALGKIHTRPNLIVPVLITSLHDPDNNVREGAVTSLAAFGTNAQSAVPELIKALHDPNPSVRSGAASSLKQIDPYVVANPTAQ
jgi:hypothetical protein